MNNIEIQNVSKVFPRFDAGRNIVLDDISFSIKSGDFVTVLGESGGGKTTLLNLIAGLESPTSGEILIDGKKIEGSHPSRSMLFQQPVLIPWLSVKDNVAYGCRLRGDLDRLDYRVHQFLEMMGLSCFENAKPSSLSLGMAQRVCLARALVGRAEMLLLDEPFASLDTFTQAHIQEELINIWLSEAFTAVFVTHDIDEAILLGNKIILLGGYPGRIWGVYDIAEPYPRNMDCEKLKSFRREILANFKRAHVGNRRFLQ
ncbi:Aliphatic sulfonates import ATP-binding protein SsuB [Desulfamplus magnetovallimortis]|uniref:Aliphatic sulfonates import ATP-binding protein SsuB n=1 Tax=Desulfamplus magnetovallimortis TaxID=1246637 RepID=A0A1W1H5A6_9BACT|nr:ABC transporter ATP-binding protein [Desulfamplus magnetovallimortis]SLM27663.1 Aliphatic sulfonates import ATP-binding protein SsuB [Desulfamplus magnetovallimortis]